MQTDLCYTEITMPQDEQNEPVYLTTKEAAERLSVSRQRVHQLIQEERLPAQKFGPLWMIREEDLELVKDRPTGRPPKRGNS
jgi:excisionase family DNA binding protein